MVTVTDLKNKINNIIPKWKNVYIHEPVYYGYTDACYRTMPSKPSHEIYIVDLSLNARGPDREHGPFAVVLNSDPSLVRDTECPCDICTNFDLTYEDATETTAMCGECIYMGLLDIMREKLDSDVITDVSAYKDDFYFSEEGMDE